MYKKTKIQVRIFVFLRNDKFVTFDLVVASTYQVLEEDPIDSHFRKSTYRYDG